jgi:cytochrome b561
MPSNMTTDVPATALAGEAPVARPAKPTRYHPAIVALHWLIPILIFATAFLAQGGGGGEGRREFRPGSTPPAGFQPGVPPAGFRPPERAGGASTINIHMTLGILILVLLIVRLILRWLTARPEWASTGSKLLDRVGELTHWALYLFTSLMTITGIVLASQRNLLQRLLGIATTAQVSFRRGGFSLGEFHGLIWVLLVLLVALHIGAALYHQFFVKDNLMARMWFGKQTT